MHEIVKNISTDKIYISKPILKWVGGKTQIINNIINEFPVQINNYHEPFLGGGSVLFTLLSYVKNGIIKINGNIYASDLNETLISVYKNIQNSHTLLFESLQNIIDDYLSCGNGKINRKPKNIIDAKINKENFYYWIRNKYNKLSSDDKKNIIGSAMFIFLNKTCFRGVFRIGPNGFNVPYGHYVNPEIINKEHLFEIHSLIQNVIFQVADFNVSLANIQSNDFIYLDPPYVPEKKNSFVAYNLNGFNSQNHSNLFNIIHSFNDNKFILSNSDVPLIRDSFNNPKYNIYSILCKRTINSKNPNAKTKEVIIKNF